MIRHISRDDAVLNTRLWVAERGLSVAECAREMGVSRTTLYTWLEDAGLRYTVRAAALLPVERER